MTSKRFRGSALSPLSSFPPADTLFFHHLENCQGSGKGCRICLRISISTFENHGSHTLLGVLPAVVPVANSLEFEGNPLPWAASPLFHPLTSFKGALPLLGQNLPTNPFCSHHNGRIREDRADRFRIRHPPLALACRLWPLHWRHRVFTTGSPGKCLLCILDSFLQQTGCPGPWGQCPHAGQRQVCSPGRALHPLRPHIPAAPFSAAPRTLGWGWRRVGGGHLEGLPGGACFRERLFCSPQRAETSPLQPVRATVVDLPLGLHLGIHGLLVPSWFGHQSCPPHHSAVTAHHSWPGLLFPLCLGFHFFP